MWLTVAGALGVTLDQLVDEAILRETVLGPISEVWTPVL
jgi:hypothetical protein